MLDGVDAAPLIGREREVALLRSVLERREPAVVLVTGPVGVGKSVVLQEVERIARGLGWNTAYQDERGRLQIDPTTGGDDFCDRVCELLGLTDEDEPGALLGGLQTYPASDVGRDPDAVVPSRLRALARQLRRLARTAPILLIVDSYQPDPAFAREFVRAFVKELARDRASVVMMVADRPRNGGLSLPATETVTIGPPAAPAIERYFQDLGRRLQPPMRPPELDAYVHRAREDPESIPALTALLELTVTGTGPAPAGPAPQDRDLDRR